MTYYPLTSYSITKVPATVGVYYLGHIKDGKFILRYVGRDDVDIQRRLREHITAIEANKEPRYTYFAYLACSTTSQAYRLECKAFHLRRSEITNEIHPARPAGNVKVNCPYSHCDYHTN